MVILRDFRDHVTTGWTGARPGASVWFPTKCRSIRDSWTNASKFGTKSMRRLRSETDRTEGKCAAKEMSQVARVDATSATSRVGLNAEFAQQWSKIEGSVRVHDRVNAAKPMHPIARSERGKPRRCPTPRLPKPSAAGTLVGTDPIAVLVSIPIPDCDDAAFRVGKPRRNIAKPRCLAMGVGDTDQTLWLEFTGEGCRFLEQLFYALWRTIFEYLESDAHLGLLHRKQDRVRDTRDRQRLNVAGDLPGKLPAQSGGRFTGQVDCLVRSLIASVTRLWESEVDCQASACPLSDPPRTPHPRRRSRSWRLPNQRRSAGQKRSLQATG